MRAVFLPGGRRLEVRALEVPEPGPGEVLIGLRAAGLCGSDLHMHYRPAPERRRGPIFGLVTDPDVVPGHEAAGVVAKVGSSVTAFKPGDRVAVHHIGGCGDCVECRRGFDMKCEHKWGIYGLDRPGALEDYMVARSRDCVALPANIDFDEAAYYTCGAGTGYLALRRASFGLGDSVAVVGLGPVGMAAAYFALRAGAVVIGLDTVESRRIFAREIGIPFVLDPADHDALARRRRRHRWARGRCSRGSLGLLRWTISCPWRRRPRRASGAGRVRRCRQRRRPSGVRHTETARRAGSVDVPPPRPARNALRHKPAGHFYKATDNGHLCHR